MAINQVIIHKTIILQLVTLLQIILIMIFKAVSLAMGVWVAVLSIVTELNVQSAIFMLAMISLNKE